MTDQQRIAEISARCEDKGNRNKNLTSGDSWQAYNYDIPFLLAQLAALREQAERSKGCEWCMDMGEFDRFEHYRIDADGHAETHANMVMANISKFCPMCGRRLEVKQDE